AEVIGAGADACPKRIRAHVAVDAGPAAERLAIDGDFEPVCCPPESPLPPASMTLRIEGESYPLARAAAVPQQGGGWVIRISRILEPCKNETTHEDVLVDLSVTGTPWR